MNSTHTYICSALPYAHSRLASRDPLLVYVLQKVVMQLASGQPGKWAVAGSKCVPVVLGTHDGVAMQVHRKFLKPCMV